MNKALSLFAMGVVLLAACGAPSNGQEAAAPSPQAGDAAQVGAASSSAEAEAETGTPEPDGAARIAVSQSEPGTPSAGGADVDADTEQLLKRGRIVFFQCRSCHTLKEGQSHVTGPNLHGLFGRQAGVVEGFGFSEALANSDVIWTAETLDPWLERPSEYIPGNVMAYAGVHRESDRVALIAYLKHETQ